MWKIFSWSFLLLNKCEGSYGECFLSSFIAFSLLKVQLQKLPQEAYLGIIYTLLQVFYRVVGHLFGKKNAKKRHSLVLAALP